MRSIAARFGLAALLTLGPVLLAPAVPAGAATWCVPGSAQKAYDAILAAAPDGSAFETKAKQIADEAKSAGQFETSETLTRLDDLAYDNGYLYDCDTGAYVFAPAETGYQPPTTTTTRPAPTTTTTRPAPTTTTRPAPTTTTTVAPSTATTTPAGAPPSPPAAPADSAASPSVPAAATPSAPGGGTSAVVPFTDESPLSVFPSGGLRPEGRGPEATSVDGGESATGAPLTHRREAVERSLLPASVRMAMKAIAVTLVLCLAGLAVAVVLNRRRTTPEVPPVA